RSSALIPRTCATWALVWPKPNSALPNGSPKRSCQPAAVHTCSVPATSEMWSSCTRVRCQASQVIELASGSIRASSAAGASPDTAEARTPSIRAKPSRRRSVAVLICLPSSRAGPVRTRSECWDDGNQGAALWHADHLGPRRPGAAPGSHQTLVAEPFLGDRGRILLVIHAGIVHLDQLLRGQLRTDRVEHIGQLLGQIRIDQRQHVLRQDHVLRVLQRDEVTTGQGRV